MSANTFSVYNVSTRVNRVLIFYCSCLIRKHHITPRLANRVAVRTVSWDEVTRAIVRNADHAAYQASAHLICAVKKEHNKRGVGLRAEGTTREIVVDDAIAST